jgi:LPXTG-site transpeptidase (sortase) family protein
MKKRKKHKTKHTNKASHHWVTKKKESISSSLRTKVLFVIGITCIFFFISWKIHEATILSFSYHPIAPTQVNKHNHPTNISIPSIHVNLPIFETNIINGIWQIAENGASHLTSSKGPGEQGTIIIYGHNTTNRFATIPFMRFGEKVILQTEDKRIYLYTVTKTLVVSSDQTEVLANQKEETLILYTCYGFGDLQRFVVIAKPKQ